MANKLWVKAVLPAYFGVSGDLDMEQKTMCSILYSAEPNVVEHGNTKDTLAVLHFGTVLAPVAFLQLSKLSKSSTHSLPKITGSVITAKTIFNGHVWHRRVFPTPWTWVCTRAGDLGVHGLGSLPHLKL